jgi:ABC-type transport system involved in multi-copper enzyme maturation permease subunit
VLVLVLVLLLLLLLVGVVEPVAVLVSVLVVFGAAVSVPGLVVESVALLLAVVVLLVPLSVLFWLAAIMVSGAAPSNIIRASSTSISGACRTLPDLRLDLAKPVSAGDAAGASFATDIDRSAGVFFLDMGEAISERGWRSSLQCERIRAAGCGRSCQREGL